MTAPPVSIVMPLRNAEATVEAAIESLQKQTYTDLDIVLVDHLSTDQSSNIIRQKAREDSRIRIFRHEGTFVEAANLAWRSSTGELVARMDSDDVAHPERIERQVALMEQQPGLSACGTLVTILKRDNESGFCAPDAGYQRYESWVNALVHHEDIFAQRFVDSPIPNPTAMIRRAAMESLGGYRDPQWAEDYDFWLRLLEAGHRVAKVDARLLDWYDSDTRSTRNLSRYDLSRFQAAKAHFLEQIPQVVQMGTVICGAGPVGKEMATLLRTKGVVVHAFLEVNTRQIGNRIQGIPVLGSENLHHFVGKATILGAVGQDGARDRIRELVGQHDFEEGKDFFCVA